MDLNKIKSDIDGKPYHIAFNIINGSKQVIMINHDKVLTVSEELELNALMSNNGFKVHKDYYDLYYFIEVESK